MKKTKKNKRKPKKQLRKAKESSGKAKKNCGQKIIENHWKNWEDLKGKPKKT